MSYRKDDTLIENIFIERQYTILEGEIGTAYGWGGNSVRQVIDEATTNISTPVQMSSDKTWKSIYVNFDASTFHHVVALRANNEMWGRGENGTGQLGQADTTDRSSWVQIGTDTDWKQVTAGADGVTLALKFDGTLWHTGSGGPEAAGSTTTSTIQQVGTDTDWKEIWATRGMFFGLKTSGDLYNCGSDSSAGEMTDGFFTTPTLCIIPTGWKKLAPAQDGFLSGDSAIGRTSVGIKDDGTLWSWGRNLPEYGNLGLGGAGALTISSPQQIGSDNDWVEVVTGQSFGVAIKVDGTIWAWGKNNRGQICQGNVTPYSTPMQIGALTDWKTVTATGESWLSVKTDGTLWGGGGDATYYTLGQGSGTSFSSPVQVGSGTNWVFVNGGRYTTVAITT